MRNAFALIHTWPDLRNAEYEVLQRVLAAARRAEVSVAVIDDNGKVLWASQELGLVEGEQLPDDTVDFLLSLHFLSPRVLDIYSYITLWQPIDFYSTFGYQKSIDAVGSHNDLLSCDSDIADLHGINLLQGLGRPPLLPLTKMFHMLPEPFLVPNISSHSRLAYIGINWERISKKKGRFHDALVALDRAGLTDIYGPEMIQGVAVWDGFETFRGELPFDGESVKTAMNRSGICLALSSVSHKRAGIMSNRLFEGLAGGAAIIATPNPLIDKHFAGVVYPVDDTRGDDVLRQQIVEAMRQIRSDPDEATRRVLEGQRILREVCSLEGSIKAMVRDTPARLAHFETVFLAQADITVILPFHGTRFQPLRDRLDQFRRQKRCAVRLEIICSANIERLYGAEIQAYVGQGLLSVTLHAATLSSTSVVFDGLRTMRDRTGPVVLRILRGIQTPYFAFARMDEAIFHDHYASVVKAISDTPTAMAGCTGMILHERGVDRVDRRTLASARFVDLDSIIHVTGTDQVGRFVFRSDLLNSSFNHLMPLLDGEEHTYFRLAALLAGPLAQSDYATFVQVQSATEAVPAPIEPVDHQRQYIRDLFARDARWLDRLGKGGKPPEFINSYMPGTPVRWESYVPPRHAMLSIPLNRPLLTREADEGLRFLAGGFSWPDADGTWIEAERGVLEFSLPNPDSAAPADYTVVLRMSGRRSVATGRQQHCTLAINGMVIGYDQVSSHAADLRIRVPMRLADMSRLIRLEITPDHSDQLFDDAGRLIDARRRSICLFSVKLEAEFRDALPTLVPGRVYRCAPNDPDFTGMLHNFYPSEIDRSWMAGRNGSLRFRLQSVPREPLLHLQLQGRASLETGSNQTVNVAINGLPMKRLSIGAQPQILCIEVPRSALDNKMVHVTLEADHAEASFDATHTVDDNRLRGLALLEVGIQDGAQARVDGRMVWLSTDGIDDEMPPLLDPVN